MRRGSFADLALFANKKNTRPREEGQVTLAPSKVTLSTQPPLPQKTIYRVNMESMMGFLSPQKITKQN
jgi:hypothetical protein